ncbi:flavodoxin [Methanobrevibacter sp. 87.7]|uniref:flavodoxin n=1 Tax=Methanobrevibacter sp. 87.7 TaxID=387957 RepID=UPI000B512197|nr:flavodoxin [Methanobrevibacter sp. 87.7]OWT33032.1 flavodoxin [Methanobrevibacter sp. 87.7]
MKSLVAYFSASGVTKAVAEKLAKVSNSDIYEIEPEEKYSSEDLDWTNPKSRSSIEMKENKEFRPPIKNNVEDIDNYDLIYLGFPIWWYTAPTIVNSFLESYDLKDKKIVVFATSGSSRLGGTIDDLKPSAPGADFVGGDRLNSSISEDDLKSWIDNLNI